MRSSSCLYLIWLQEDVQEDFGWKLVHGEVFRPPRSAMVLSVLVGNGAQLCAMVCVTLCMSIQLPRFLIY